MDENKNDMHNEYDMEPSDLIGKRFSTKNVTQAFPPAGRAGRPAPAAKHKKASRPDKKEGANIQESVSQEDALADLTSRLEKELDGSRFGQTIDMTDDKDENKQEDILKLEKEIEDLQDDLLPGQDLEPSKSLAALDSQGRPGYEKEKKEAKSQKQKLKEEEKKKKAQKAAKQQQVNEEKKLKKEKEKERKKRQKRMKKLEKQKLKQEEKKKKEEVKQKEQLQKKIEQQQAQEERARKNAEDQQAQTEREKEKQEKRALKKAERQQTKKERGLKWEQEKMKRQEEKRYKILLKAQGKEDKRKIKFEQSREKELFKQSQPKLNFGWYINLIKRPVLYLVSVELLVYIFALINSIQSFLLNIVLPLILILDIVVFAWLVARVKKIYEQNNWTAVQACLLTGALVGLVRAIFKIIWVNELWTILNILVEPITMAIIAGMVGAIVSLFIKSKYKIITKIQETRNK